MSTHPADPQALSSSSTPRTSTASTRLSDVACRRPLALCAATIIALTMLGAIASVPAPGLGPDVAPHPVLHGDVGEAAAIFVGNVRTLGVPLLLSAGRWHTHRLTRRLGDLLVATLVAGNALLIGVALGRYPTTLPAYLPHLPLEDAALTVAASAWITRRLPHHTARARVSVTRSALLTAALAAIAALVETYAVAHTS